MKISMILFVLYKTHGLIFPLTEKKQENIPKTQMLHKTIP